MNEMLSQEEIDALLKGSDDSIPNETEVVVFTEEEKDTIGEIGNISMGTAATTLSTLLGHKVTITTPKVTVSTISELSREYPLPFVAVDVKYKEGLEGTNLLILKEDDVKLITDLMMGGEGKPTTDPLSDLHLSAIGEAMNQMVGSSSTSLSEMFNKKIDINPPEAFLLDLSSDDFLKHFSNPDDVFVRIAFKMVVGDLIDSQIMQLIPLSFAKEIVDTLLNNTKTVEDKDNNIKENKDRDVNKMKDNNLVYDNTKGNSYSTGEMSNQHYQSRLNKPMDKINVQPVQFQSFDESSVKGVPENIALIQDVPLKVTVELGKTVKKISEILEFGPGTIVELDRLVGEPLDILVNGQYVAKGEVVVIDENYGIRITDIVNPVKRFSKIYE